MTSEPQGYERGVRYHAPRRREPGPVLAVAAILLILLVAGQMALASARETEAMETVSAPAATATAEPSTGGGSEPASAGVTVAELQFDSGADAPGTGSEELLDQVAEELLDDPDAMVRVVGHAEPSNDADLEKQLSLERALRVVDLLGRRGVAAERVQVVAAGATQAPDPDDGDDGETTNSRVTLEVTTG